MITGLEIFVGVLLVARGRALSKNALWIEKPEDPIGDVELALGMVLIVAGAISWLIG